MNRFPSIVLSLALLGCAEGGEIPCRFGADCPTGVCLPDGVCQMEGEDAGIGDAGPIADDAGNAPDAGGEDAGPDPIDAGPPGCGDADGLLTRAELPLPLDVAIEQRSATSVSVDTHGAERPDGSRVWDLEGPFTGDADRTVRRTALDGAWYAADFAGATYVLPLGVASDLLGVFELTSDALLLRGIVSPADGITRTALTYDPPMPVWRFPLEDGATWTQTSSVSGLASGITSVASETWAVSVDAHGQLGSPGGVREVLRVNTSITRTVGFLVTVSRRLSWVEECVGTVGQVSGVDGDTTVEPTFASELWRVAR